MSMSFVNPVSAELAAKIAEEFGQPVATDRKTFLFNRFDAINSKLMKEIANEAKQPVTVEMNGEGEIKTMSDGTQYRVTPQGWKKIEAQ